MEFQNHSVTQTIVSLVGLSLEIQKVQRTENYQNRYGLIHSVRLLTCDFEIIHQNSRAIDGANELIHEMRNFVEFSEYNIVNDHC
jgi:hypothetical protein